MDYGVVYCNISYYLCTINADSCRATRCFSNYKYKESLLNKRMKMAKSEFRVVRETVVNTPKSLLTMKKGETITIQCNDFTPYSTVKSACTRLNQRFGLNEFDVSTPDNGATIVVKREADATPYENKIVRRSSRKHTEYLNQ